MSEPRQPRTVSAHDFALLARRAGLTLTAAQLTEMHAAFAVVEAMAARVRTARTHEAEPALIFSVDRSHRR
jgi:hypothetical protein